MNAAAARQRRDRREPPASHQPSSPRVFMVTSAFYPYEGGTERQALLLSRTLVAHGTPVTVLTPRFRDLPRHEVVDEVHVARLPFAPQGRGLTRAAWYVYLGSLARFLVAHGDEYDVLHCHMLSFPAFVATAVAGRLGKPVVIKVAAGGQYGELRNMADHWARFFLPPLPHGRLRAVRERAGARLAQMALRVFGCADAVIAISEAIGGELSAAGFLRILQIPNGVDTDRFAPVEPGERQRLRARFGLSEHAWVLAFVGRLSAEKGLDFLLPAWAAAAPPGGVLVLAGAGPEEAALRWRADALGVAGSVRFAGLVAQVEDLLGAADAFVLSSRSEGMSNALLEAMACGLPCVSTRVSGSEDLIEDGRSGLLVPPGDTDALAAAIRGLFERPAEAWRMGEEARHTIERTCSAHAVAEQYRALYDALLAGRAGGCPL